MALHSTLLPRVYLSAEGVCETLTLTQIHEKGKIASWKMKSLTKPRHLVLGTAALMQSLSGPHGHHSLHREPGTCGGHRTPVLLMPSLQSLPLPAIHPIHIF